MDKKRYWVRGGWVGFIVYMLFILGSYVLLTIYKTESPDNYLAVNVGVPISMVLCLPTIPLGFFLGWLYGKIKNRNNNI